MADRFSKKEKTGLVIAAVFIMMVGFDRIVVHPISERIVQLDREINTAEKQYARYLRTLHRKESIRGEYEKYTQYIRQSGSDEEEVSMLLSGIEEVAAQAHIRLVNMKPYPSRSAEFGREYTVEAEAEGDAGSLIKLFYLLHVSPELKRIDMLNLKLKEKGSSAIRCLLVVSRLVVSNKSLY